MSAWAVFPVGITVVIAAVAWTLWKTRPERKPMPPLIRRIPGKPIDGEPCTDWEIEQLVQLGYSLRHETTDDPMEQR